MCSNMGIPPNHIEIRSNRRIYTHFHVMVP